MSRFLDRLKDILGLPVYSDPPDVPEKPVVKEAPPKNLTIEETLKRKKAKKPAAKKPAKKK